MATLDIEIQDRIVAKFGSVDAQTYAKILDGETAAKALGIIMPMGVIPVGQAANAGTLLQWNCFADSHGTIGGYRRLRFIDVTANFVTRTVTFAGTPIPTGEQTIEEYASSSNEMQGTESNGSTMEAAVRARKVPDAAEVNKVRLEVYHRTSGGTETLLDSFTTPDLTGSFVKYTGNITFTQSWETGSLLVVKLIGINDGVPG